MSNRFSSAGRRPILTPYFGAVDEKASASAPSPERRKRWDRRSVRFESSHRTRLAAPPPAAKKRLVFAVLVLVAAVRLPSARWDAISDDEGIYDAMGVVLNQGGLMYREAVDHKPPGLAYTYAWMARLCGPTASASQRIGAVHALGALVAMGTALGLYLLGRQSLPRRAQLWPPLLFAVSSTAKIPFDGLAVNGELLMGLPSIWALVSIEAAGRKNRFGRWLLDVSAGALCAVAVLYKWQAGVLIVPMACLGVATQERLAFRAWCARALSWGLGSGLILFAVAMFFWRRGGLTEAIEWGLLFNRTYLADGTGGLFWWKRLGQGVAGAVLPIAALYGFGLGTLVRWLRRSHVSPVQTAIAMWGLVSFAAVALGGRFFGHYFLQAELPLCLLAAAPWSKRWRSRRWRQVAACTILVPWCAFFALASAPSGALALLNPRDPDWRALGHSIAAHAIPGDTLFVWGNAPLVYHFANLPMGTRFSFCNYLTGISPGTSSERSEAKRHKPAGESTKGSAELWSDLLQRRPSLVFDSSVGNVKGYGRYPLVEQLMWAEVFRYEYQVIARFSGGVLYRRQSH